MSNFHMVVWIDHESAQVYRFQRDGLTLAATLRTPDEGSGHIHHRAGTPGPGHSAVDHGFLEQVAAPLAQAREILVVGPGGAKVALKTFLEKRHPEVAARIVGIEPMPRASASEIHAMARQSFRHADSFNS